MHKLTAIITRYGKRKLEVTDPEAVTTIVSVSELYKYIVVYSAKVQARKFVEHGQLQ